jgi:hypothetical protein
MIPSLPFVQKEVRTVEGASDGFRKAAHPGGLRRILGISVRPVVGLVMLEDVRVIVRISRHELIVRQIMKPAEKLHLGDTRGGCCGSVERS